MMNKQRKLHQEKLLIIGFGSIGQALLPLLFDYVDTTSENITIFSADENGINLVEQYKVNLHIAKITSENYQSLLNDFLHEGVFLINLSVNIASVDLIKLCQEKNVLYIDTCTEPWQGGYIDQQIPLHLRTNYALRETVLNLKQRKGSTAVMTHGANPGLVSHFLKQALLNIAKKNNLVIDSYPTESQGWAKLAHHLGIKAVHIAERDSQIANKPKLLNEFVNTWSADGFIGESSQPAELGWGTHERHWPAEAKEHQHGSKCAIYLNRPGASTKVRTWIPSIGAAHGFLITHAESISIANYLTLKDEQGQVLYRPTVHYAYIPCPDAILSLHELAGREYIAQKQKRLVSKEIIEGEDELGILLMGNLDQAYWYGSQLSIQDARRLAPYNNATSLPVVMGIITGMLWAIEHPNLGVIEPEDIDHQFVLDIAKPYLGVLAGYYTNWHPLQNRESLFSETLDYSDPWQFLNILIK